MRTMVPVTRCDTDDCGTDIDPLTRSTSVTVTWPDGTSETYVGEDCEDHEDDLREAVSSVLNHHLRLESQRKGKAARVIDLDASPRRASPQAVAFGTTPLPEGMDFETALELVNTGRCIYPDCDFAGDSGRESAGGHLRGKHGVSLSNLGLGQRGIPITTIKAARQRGGYPDERLTCPRPQEHDDAKQYVAPTRQQLSAHARKVHGTTLSAWKEEGALV